MKKEVAFGIWTPTANILCYECHGKNFKNCSYNKETGKFEDKILSDEEFKKANTPGSIKENYAVTKCNKCSKDIQLYEEVAKENNLRMKLVDLGLDAYMWQTGGMNSAVGVHLPNENELAIVFDNESDISYSQWLVEEIDKDGECLLDKSVVVKDEEIIDIIKERVQL